MSKWSAILLTILIIAWVFAWAALAVALVRAPEDGDD